MTVIDFRNTQQAFYGGSEIKEVWYQGEKVWEKAGASVHPIFQATIPITKIGNTIMMNFGYSAWRYGRPEAINGKTIRFTTGAISYDYTIRLSDAQATTMSLMFTTPPTALQSGVTYRVELFEDVPAMTSTVEWRAMQRTEVIPKPTTYVKERPDLYPHESYTESGNEGSYIVRYEAEYINGQPTGNIRNERKYVDVIPNHDVYHKGVKSTGGWETLFDGELSFYGTVVTSEPSRYARFMIVNKNGVSYEFVMDTADKNVNVGGTVYYVRRASNGLIVGGGSGTTVIKGLPK